MDRLPDLRIHWRLFVDLDRPRGPSSFMKG